MNAPRVAGLVAAAGRSSRMGRAKALVELSGERFVERLVRVLLESGVAPVVVTVPEPPDDAAVVAHLAARFLEEERPEEERPEEERLVVVRNAFWAEGLSGSVRTALEHAGEVDALVMTPVDAPFATVPLVEALLGAVVREGARAAVPVVDGAWGHPVVFARSAFGLLREADQRGGPRGVLEALGDDVTRVPWGDVRVTLNVNTPEALDAVTRNAPDA